METLQENMESVSLDVDKTRRVVKRSASAGVLQMTKGLGLSTNVRRPSDGLRSQGKVSMQRPISNDSIPSTTGSVMFDDPIDSRHSSMTSTSLEEVDNISDPAMSKFNLRVTASTPSLLTRSNTSVSTLTPSQRYRLRRVNSSSSKMGPSKTSSAAAKLFDELNSDDETIEDGLIWNVPFTRAPSSVFNPSNGKSPALIKTVLEQSPALLPMSPLPGSPMAMNTSTFYIHGDEAHSISRLYERANDHYTQREVTKRKLSQITLPMMVNEASSRGLDDCKLVSREKLNVLSQTRPIWLPPKESSESLKHDKDYQKMIAQVARKEKLLEQQRLKKQEDQKKFKQRWLDLSQSSHFKLVEMQKLVLKCPIPEHLRYKMWTQVMMSYSSSAELEDYEQLQTKLSSIAQFPESQLDKIDCLTSSVFKRLHKFQKGEELHDKLVDCLKLQMISKNGFKQGDEILFSLMLLKFNRVDSFKLIQLFQSQVYTKLNCDKFTKNLERSVVKRYLPAGEYSQDLKQLTASSLILLFQHLPTEYIFPIFDLLVIKDSPKLWLSIWVVILREHHLGFNNLEDLFTNDEHIVMIMDDWPKFATRVMYYYKRF